MKSYFYPKSLYTSKVAFADMFNDMTTRVYDRDGRIVGVKPVVMTFAPKEKIASILTRSDVNDVDPQVDNYLPRISVNMTNIAWDSERMRGKFEERTLNIEYYDHEVLDEYGKPKRREMQKDLQPIPYNLTFEVIIWTKYDSDMTQILENILPWFAPQSHISIKERNFGIERKSKVTLDSTSINNVYELGENDRRVLQTNLTFTMETVVYKPMEIKKEILCAIISIADVPCKRAPFQGSKIIATDIADDQPFCLEDRDVAVTINELDAMDSYDLMVQYWQYANNNMKPNDYVKCVNDNCFVPLGERPVWDAESDYKKCDPPIRAPYIHNNEDTGYIDWYFQKTITGLFDVPDDKIDGFNEEDLPPLNGNNTRTFGKSDIINVWHFKRVVQQTGETVLDENGKELIFLINPDQYPEIQNGSDRPQDIPPELEHLG